jgi:hypothetical protein
MAVWLKTVLITICKSQLSDGSAQHRMRLCISLSLTRATSSMLRHRVCPVLARVCVCTRSPSWCVVFNLITVSNEHRGGAHEVPPGFFL